MWAHWWHLIVPFVILQDIKGSDGGQTKEDGIWLDFIVFLFMAFLPKGHDEDENHDDGLHELIGTNLLRAAFMCAALIVAFMIAGRLAAGSAPRSIRTTVTARSTIRRYMAKDACNTHIELQLKVLALVTTELVLDMTLLMLSKRFILRSLLLILSSSSIRVSRLSVTLHSSFTAPTFSM